MLSAAAAATGPRLPITDKAAPAPRWRGGAGCSGSATGLTVALAGGVIEDLRQPPAQLSPRVAPKHPLAHSARRLERALAPALVERAQRRLDRLGVAGVGGHAGVPLRHEPGREVVKAGDAQH